MSEGSRFIGACLNAGSPGPLLAAPEDLFLDGPEILAFHYTCDHFREYGSLPTHIAIRENTGAVIPANVRDTPQYYMDQLYARLASNSAKEPYARLRESMKDATPAGIAEAQAATAELMQALRGTRQRDNVHTMQMVGDAIMARFNKAMRTEGLAGVTSGWHEIDNKTQGWQDSDLIGFIGRPMMGKTYILLWQVWAAIMSGRRVLLITTEMSPEQMGRRLAVMHLGLDPHRLKEGRVPTHIRRMIMAMFQTEQFGESLYFASMGLSSSTQAVEALVEELQPDLVAIDGMYLLRPRKKGNMTRTEKVAEVTDELKQQTIDFQKPYLFTAQFNRGAGEGGKQGSLETVGMTDAISQHCSILVAIKPGSTIDPRGSRDLEFFKGREGEEGTTTIRFRFKPVDFGVMSPDEIQAADDEAAQQGIVE